MLGDRSRSVYQGGFIIHPTIVCTQEITKTFFSYGLSLIVIFKDKVPPEGTEEFTIIISVNTYTKDDYRSVMEN